MTLELGENLFGLCLSYLNIIDYNWMLNLLRPEAAVILCKKWKKESNRFYTWGGHVDIFNGKIYYSNEMSMQTWFDSKGQCHREGEPAIITSISEVWIINGKKHRIGGPAVIDPYGTKEWWVDGKKHRLDGPAVIYRSGSKEWWVDGVKS